MPVGGLLLGGGRELGRLELGYADQINLTSAAPIIFRRISVAAATDIIAITPLDDAHAWVLVDQSGLVYHLELELEGCQLRVIGRVGVTPSCIAYLHNDFLFFGSTLRDSIIARLTGIDGHLEVMEKISNLGSVIAMCVTKPGDAAGQGCVAACCGTGDMCNLRIIHDGIDITGATVGIPPQQVRNLWILKSPHGHIIIISSAKDTVHTFLIANDGSTATAIDPPGFDAATPTICCCDLGDEAVQVTPKGAFKFDAIALRSYHGGVWRPNSGRITVATGNGEVLVVSMSDGRLVLLDRNLKTRATKFFLDEMSCVAASPFSSASFAGLGMSSAVAVATWSNAATGISIHTATLKDTNNFVMPWRENLSKVCSPQVVRAITLTDMNEAPYVFCAAGGGLILLFRLSRGNDGLIITTESRAVSLGVQPAQITVFSTQERAATTLLCCSDRGCVIRSQASVAPLECIRARLTAFEVISDWNGCLIAALSGNDDLAIIACLDRLTVCTIDTSRSIKALTVPLGEQAHCICHERYSHIFTIGTVSYGDIDHGVVHFLRDKAPFDHVHRQLLEPLEHPLCCSVVHLENINSSRSATYIAMGTVFAVSKQFEPTTGRILIFNCNDVASSVSTIVMAAEANGAVYDIASMRASYLVCAVNHVVHVYSVGSGLRQPAESLIDQLLPWTLNCVLLIRREASYDGLIVALKVRCRGSLIIIGDMMRSITLLKFNPWQPALVEIAHDYNANWTCALEAFTDGSFLIAEASGNLVALDRCCSGSDIDYCLESRARMHLGDVVACFARGSLTTRNDWPNTRDVSTPLLFGCVSPHLQCV
jgi:DNA damage-binding protein 1